MKKKLLTLCFLLFTFLLSTFSYSQTTLEFASGISGSGSTSMTSTELSGLTITFSAAGGNLSSINAGGLGGSTTNVAFASGPTTSMTLSFSVPVDIVDVLHLDPTGFPETLTFTPTGGSNSTVMSSHGAGGGNTATLNWTGVTAFTITGAASSGQYAIDKLQLSVAASGTAGTVDITEASITPGSSFTITVNDADLNTNTGVAETVDVEVDNSTTGENETVTLTETGINTGIFTASLGTTFGTTAGTNDTGNLNVQASDAVGVSYTDASPAGSDSDTVTITGGTTGSIDITEANIAPGTSFNISVTDADLNTNTGVAETVDVEVNNNTTGENETVTLTETGINTGIFTASLATTFGTTAGTNDTGNLNVQASDNVTATYSDAFTASGGTASPSDSVTINGGTTGTVDITEANINPGDTFNITVTDGDLNTNTGVAETVDVEVNNNTTGENETVTLTETGINTGIFTASLATTFGTTAGTNDTGNLNVQGGDNVTATYSDAFTASGGTASPNDSVTINSFISASVNDPSVSEGDSGSTTLTFTVTLSAAAPAGGATVDFATSDGTASSSSDYTSNTGTVSFSVGETSKTIDVTVSGDTDLEVDETITMTLSNPTGTNVVIGDATGTGTITNDDAAAVTIADVSGNEDDGDLTFTATLDNPVQGGFTVDVNTIDGTAEVADNDYTAITGQILTFVGTAGETQTFTVSPTPDNKVEEDETVTIGMTTVDNTPSFNDISITDTATATFTNDDATEVTILEDVDVDEDAGFATLTATLSNPVQGGFFINVTTADGTAVATDDYTASNDEPNVDFVGTAGETQSILIPIVDDSQGELSETFTVTLTSVSGTTLGSFITTTDSATVTIIDNDAPVVSAVAVPADGLYGIGNSLDFTVTFTDFVTSTGTPLIPITIGTTTVNAELSAPVTGSLTATFSYTILEGEVDLDGIEVGTDIALNGGTLIGSNSNIDAILTLNGVASTANINVDGIRPIPLITSTVPDPTNAAFEINIIFDEPVTGFTLAGIDVTNGTASNLVEVSSTEYTATITPTADGIVNMIILAESAFDAAGNGNVPSNEFSVEYDATRPTPTVSSTTPDPTNTIFDVTISFTEDVTGFELADITVTNGTAGNFIQVSASEYTATITPAADGDVTVEVLENVSEDAATNGNVASNAFTVEYDTTPPVPPMITHISEYTCSGTTMMTGDNTLEISGTAERESIVEVFLDGVSIGTTVTDAESGFFTFDYTGTTLADGTYAFTAQATDTAVNTSGLSAPFSITINTVDSDGDGNPDFCDQDDNGNGDTDTEEDCDGDGIVDSQDNDNSSCRIPIQQRRTYGFSPNGDGINEGWVIENITAFPNNTVSLYSRSGKLVFRASNYQNDFEGISNQISGNGLGTKLPVGPYVYLIDLGDGSTPVRGWLYVNY